MRAEKAADKLHLGMTLCTDRRGKYNHGPNSSRLRMVFHSGSCRHEVKGFWSEKAETVPTGCMRAHGKFGLVMHKLIRFVTS
jgi:hypothetical protein